MSETDADADSLLPQGEWHLVLSMAAKKYVLTHLKLPVHDDSSIEINLPGFPKKDMRLAAIGAAYKLSVCFHCSYQNLYDWEGPESEINDDHHETLEWVKNFHHERLNESLGFQKALSHFGSYLVIFAGQGPAFEQHQDHFEDEGEGILTQERIALA